MSDGKPNPNSRHSKYSIEGDKLVRKAPFCPNPACGEGIFLVGTQIDGPAGNAATPPRK